MSKACIDDRSDSLIFQHKRRPRVIGFTYASSEAHFRSTESQTFYRPILTANDSIKCRCANSGMTGQVGGFQNPGVCLQAFPSFLSHPLSALLLAPFFARSLTLIPRSLLLNRTETLATQAMFYQSQDWSKTNKLKMTNKRGTVKLFTFSFEIDVPNIISCAPKLFSCTRKISAVRLKIYIWSHKCSQTQI